MYTTGKDGARYQVPFLAERNRQHRLDIENILRPLSGADVEVGIVLERQADQIGDGILCLLGQVFL